MPATVAVLSDIHGNMPALEAVVAALPPHDGVYVAGDLCLDGPSPDEVIDFIRERGWTAVMGNTDRDILQPPRKASAKTRKVDWTREVLGGERLRWLGSLPFSAEFSLDGRLALQVVHANPLDMDTHLYPDMSSHDLEPYLEHVEAEILAFGHFHIPYLRPVGRVLLADVASVGHPKDLDHRAACTLVRWHAEARSVEQLRVPYDIDRTVALLRRSGMPHAEEQIAALLAASYSR